MNETVKIEDENILDGFKDACENRFIHQSNDEERCIVNAKRKRKQNSMINQDVKEEEKRKWTVGQEQIQNNYTKMHDWLFTHIRTEIRISINFNAYIIYFWLSEVSKLIKSFYC